MIDSGDWCRHLARAVFNRAALDARLFTLDKQGQRQPCYGYRLTEDVLEARKWLTSPSEGLTFWAQWLELDPKALIRAFRAEVLVAEERERKAQYRVWKGRRKKREAMAVYDGNWTSRADIVNESEYGDDIIPSDDEIVYAAYDTPPWEGEALIVFERDGELWEVNDYHCSCYGLENWGPEKTSAEALRMRLNDQRWQRLDEALTAKGL